VGGGGIGEVGRVSSSLFGGLTLLFSLFGEAGAPLSVRGLALGLSVEPGASLMNLSFKKRP
jgi:hypothetical protein